MVEHLSEEQGVVSSILTLGTNAPLVQWMRISCYEREGGGSIPSWGAKFMEVWQSLVYCTCLENRRVEMLREFESHRFRQYYACVAEGISTVLIRQRHWFDSNRRYQCPAGQIGKVISLKRRSSPCSNQGQGTKSYYAEMMELVYMLVLETKSCGFESHSRHQMKEVICGK